MKAILTKPKYVIIGHALLLFALWSVGGFVLSDGWLQIDSSAHRDLMYTLLFKVIPVVVILSAVHIAATIARARVWVPSLIAALLLGAAGPALLQFSIITSDDPVADMAYVSLVQAYSLFFLIAFVTLCWVVSRKNRRTRQGVSEFGAASDGSSAVRLGNPRP